MRIRENGRSNRDSESLGRFHFCGESRRHNLAYRDKQEETRVLSQKYHGEPFPSQHLWVGNISTSVTEMTLAEQFSRFGDIESLKLYSTKNYAFVTLNTVEDAMYAKKRLHGTVLGGLAIRIEFVKGDSKQYYVKKEEKSQSCSRNPKDNEPLIKNKGLDGCKASHKKDAQESIEVDTGINQTVGKPKGNRTGEPSEVLWIGFPLHLRIDERKLQKIFAPFGGVEHITAFPGRTYAFVRFQNVKSASRAKNALQGKLFNDPRVSISFAKSEMGSVDLSQGSNKVSLSFPTVVKNTTIEHTSSSGKREVRMGERCHPAIETRDTMTSASKLGNPLGLQDDKYISHNSKTFDSAYNSSRSASLANEIFYSGRSPSNKIYFSDVSQNSVISKNEWRLNSNIVVNTEMPNRDGQLGNKVAIHEWSQVEISISKQKRHRIGSDYSVGEPSFKFGCNELKRQRLEDSQPIHKDINNISLSEGNIGVSSLWDTKHTYGDASHSNQVYWGGENVQLATHKDNHEDVGNIEIPFSCSSPDHAMGFPDKKRFPVTPICLPPEDVHPSPKDLFRWEGTIAKGGTEVCHCRCFPATKEINIKFPDVLDCTARTSLDMLAQYITQVKSFAVVLFMPQGVVDVKPYQELMAFLVDKKRAAVCKLSEEDTLFLVPPSDFMEEFLKVPKSNNILGVVLGQQQFLSEIPQALSDQTALSQNDKTLLLDDLKELSYQELNFNTTSEHPFIDSYTSDLSMSAGQNKTSIGPVFQGTAFANRVLFHGPLSDSNKMEYPMLGNNLTLDGNKNQTGQNGPMQQDVHATGKLNSEFKMQPQNDIANHSQQSETVVSCEQSKPNVSYSQTRLIIESQNGTVTSPFHDQSSFVDSAMLNMNFTPIVQPELSLAQSHQFSYSSVQQSSDNLIHDVQQGLWAASSNYAFKSVLQPAGSLQMSPTPPPSLFSVEPTGGEDKQTMAEIEEHKMIQITQKMSTIENQRQSELHESQKKFKATLELAAALLQQLQKQTKL